MTSNASDKNKPLGRFKASEAGLRQARAIAERLGESFDDTAVALEADRLHQTYFEEIVNCLGPTVTAPQFVSGSYRIVNAFAGRDSSEQSLVGFDEILDFWLMDMTHLTVVAACVALTPDEYAELVDVFGKRLDVRADPWAHEETRDTMSEFLVEHHECLAKLSHPISKALIAFVICHEIAHCSLDHLSGPASPDKELEADALAAQYFRRLIEAGERMKTMTIDPKLAGAPVLLQNFFAVHEQQIVQRTGRAMTRDTHPAPADRVKALEAVLDPLLTDKAKYLLEGLQLALKGIAEKLEGGSR